MASQVFFQLLNELAGLVRVEGLRGKASAVAVADTPTARGAFLLEGIAAVANVQLAVRLPNRVLMTFIRSSRALERLSADALVAEFGGQACVQSGAGVIIAARMAYFARRMAGRERRLGELRKFRKLFSCQLRFQFSNEREV